MVLDVSKIAGIHDHTAQKDSDREIYFKGEHAFLVLNNNTVEVRCDKTLGDHLTQKYESVMESRYFGKGGIEIVLAGQLTEDEVKDLIRLSYDLTT